MIMVVTIDRMAMIIGVFFALQSSYAQSVSANDARSSARDALNRMSIQIRTAQPLVVASAGQAVFTSAGPWEVQFYSSFNVLGQGSDYTGTAAAGAGTAALQLTRIYLSGPMPYQ